MTKFSVLIPVFYKANPLFFKEALHSVLKQQSYKPTEVIIVVDGTPTQAITEVITTYENLYPNQIKTTILPKHKGTGYALKIGVELCNYELVARMDADDISVFNRFEKQLNFMKNNPEIDVLGGAIEEFKEQIGDLKQYRVVPEYHKKIKKLAKFRSSINHPTIVFKKSKVLEAGNYSNEFYLLEDYALLVAMLQKNFKFHNLQEVLLHFRVGNKITEKRRGDNLVKAYLGFTKYAYKLEFYTIIEYGVYAVLRFLFFGIFPPKFFSFLRKKITRKKYNYLYIL